MPSNFRLGTATVLIGCDLRFSCGLDCLGATEWLVLSQGNNETTCAELVDGARCHPAVAIETGAEEVEQEFHLRLGVCPQPGHPRPCNVQRSQLGGAAGPTCWPLDLRLLCRAALDGVDGITLDLADLFES